MKTILILFTGMLLLTLSCKKDKEPKEDTRLIQSLTKGNITTRLLYDNQQRLSRIDYGNNQSARFEYNTAGITVKFYEGAAVDPREYYEFSLTGNRIASGRRYFDDGAAWDIFYGYDGEQRLTEIGVRAATNTGTVYQKYDCYFSYDEQRNLSELALNGFKGTGSRTDSVVMIRTYYEDKPFFSFRNIGFDYFGSVPAGFEYNGSILTIPLLLPFPFLQRLPGVDGPAIFPAQHALKQEITEGKALNSNLPPQYAPVEWSFSPGEAEYAYDQQGSLSKSGLYSINWQ